MRLDRRLASPLALLILTAACGSADPEAQAQPRPGANRTAPTGSFVEGKDYVVFKRVRFLDSEGFDRPIEAFSMLFPQGWRAEGGVQWGSIGGCRGEIARNIVKAASPDGAFEFQFLPVRSFQWAADQFMLNVLQAGARAGGCQINQPFDAKQYIEGFARMDLGGAQASNLQFDENQMASTRRLDEQLNAIGQPNGSSQQSTVAFGDLKFPDGSEGIMTATVVNMYLRKANYVTGGTDVSTTTLAVPFLIRFPAGRREEGARLMKMIMSSQRVNPVWKQATQNFLNQIGQIEHAGNMRRIQLMGEQARAYAEAANAASDQRMRDWENRQASQDQQHKSFVQTIREVETWKDASGASVELTSGYDKAWTRGDGRYILSNSATFDPSSAFRDQQWQPMQRSKP